MSTGILKCCVCGRSLSSVTAYVHGGAVGPVCARKIGIKAKHAPRTTGTSAVQGAGDQVDWIAQSAEVAP